MFHLTDHAEQRMRQRHITSADLEQALAEPLLVYPGKTRQGPAMVFRGERATVVVGHSHRIVTVYAGACEPPETTATRRSA